MGVNTRYISLQQRRVMGVNTRYISCNKGASSMPLIGLNYTYSTTDFDQTELLCAVSDGPVLAHGDDL